MKKIKPHYLIGGLLALLILKLLSNQITFNPSISEPQGYYVLSPIFNNLRRGDLVILCLDNRRYLSIAKKLQLPFNNSECKNNVAYLLKKVVAISGDRVEVKKSGIYINEILAKNSQALNNFKGINLYPQKERRFILNKNEFLVLGMTPHSFDSRYFGVIVRSQIKFKAYLIF